MIQAKNSQLGSSLKATIKDRSGSGKWKLGEFLLKQGCLTLKQLEHAKKFQMERGGLLSSILLRLGFIDQESLFSLIIRHFNFPPVDLAAEVPTQEALEALPYAMAKHYMAIPLRITCKTLKIAMAEPTDTELVGSLREKVNMGLSLYVAEEKCIIEAFRTRYAISDEEYAELRGLTKGEGGGEDAPSIDDFGQLITEATDSLELETLTDEQEDEKLYSYSDAPIIKLVNGMLIKAVKEGASDIHIEPYERSVQVRFRMDGALFTSMNLPVEIRNALVSRIKILASLDITERRKPQDGRVKIRVGTNRHVDFRVSSLPTLFGERIVLRVLDKNSLQVDLGKLGLEQEEYALTKRCISRPQGLVLVTGPTGSGKTVTLYSILNAIKSQETNIMTAEDPVEFNFRGIGQVDINNEVGMTFAAALRAFLRQDPDVIMVGEIRDLETAEIAMKAAMTGHLVFSTLHTNDCVATISRLLDIGVPAYNLASALTLVMAQRLGRRLCTSCRTPLTQAEPERLAALGLLESDLQSGSFFAPNGCEHCKGSGYKGRVGFFEVLEVEETIAKAISSGVSEEQLRKIAIMKGMQTLRKAALDKARQGITSLDEVLKRTVATGETLPAHLAYPELETYQNGEVIIREGNEDTDYYRLVRGAASVIKNGRKLYAYTQPGEIFGEMAAICGVRRTATVVADGLTVVRRFRGDKIFESIESQPEMVQYILQSFAHRLIEANKLIVNMEINKEKRALKDPYFFQAWAHYGSGEAQQTEMPHLHPPALKLLEKEFAFHPDKNIIM